MNPSGYPQVLAEETSTNFGFTNYTWGLELISRVDFSSGQPIYFAHDGHGSVRELTNPSGAVTDTYDYDAFGNLLHSTGTTPNVYLFADEQFDLNLNLYYNRARYLSTNTGRFWTMDTYEGDPQSPLSLHKYVYARANPVNSIDPSGNQIVDIAAFAVADTLSNLSGLNYAAGLDSVAGATSVGYFSVWFTRKFVMIPTRLALTIRWPYPSAKNPLRGVCLTS